MNQIDITKSNCIYYMKAFAIISVVCAHISVVPDEFSFTSQYVCNILYEIGSVGVGVFFAIAGYLFNSKRTKAMKFCEMILHKIKMLGPPWIISATLVYLYVAVRKGGNVKEYLLSVLGVQSSYWFLPVLLMLFILYFCRINRPGIIYPLGLGTCTFFSLIMRQVGIISPSAWGVYLNVFNWTIFFSMGFIAAYKKEYIENFSCNNLKRVIVLTILFSVPLFIFGSEKSIRISYYCMLYVPFEIISIIFIFELSKLLSRYNLRLLTYLGRMAFCIYLWHELLWAGLSVRVGARWDLWALILIRPLFVITMVSLEMEAGKLFFRKINKEDFFCKLVGIR